MDELLDKETNDLLEVGRGIKISMKTHWNFHLAHSPLQEQHRQREDLKQERQALEVPRTAREFVLVQYLLTPWGQEMQRNQLIELERLHKEQEQNVLNHQEWEKVRIPYWYPAHSTLVHPNVYWYPPTPLCSTNQWKLRKSKNPPIYRIKSKW